MKPGYKQTEVGVIPEDWQAKPIGEFRPYVTSGSRGWAKYYSANGAPFIRITNLSRYRIHPNLEDLRLVQVDESDSEGMRTQLRQGDVLISITADIGIIGYVDSCMPTPSYINQHIALVRFDPTRIAPKFISYFLASSTPQKRFKALADSGAKAGMNLTTVQQVLTAVPPTISEQDAIAEALGDADALIESLAQILTKKRDLKQGAMQELLTGKRRLQGFDGIWDQMWLRDCADVLTGFPFPSAGYVESGVRLLRGSNIKRGTTDWSDGLCQYWPNLSSEISKYQLRKNDIVVAMDGSLVGRSFAQISEGDLPCILLQRVACIRSKSEKYAIEFLKEWVCSELFTIHCDSLKTVTAIPHISRDDILKFAIQIPRDPHEQTAIATILSEMDTEITYLESKLTKARELKQGMMQELLTGRIRVI